ncbi:MAG: PAS domain S-box protein [Candidatus Helarchaeota archaeon]
MASEDLVEFFSRQEVVSLFIIQGGRVQYVNEAASRMSEYSVGEMLKWTLEEFSKLIHPQDLSSVLDQIQKPQADDLNRIKKCTFRILTKSGKVKWVETHFDSSLYMGKRAIYVSLTDVTSSKCALKALQETEMKYFSLLEYARDGVVIIQDNRIKFANSQIAEISGYSVEELIGSLFIKYISRKDRGWIKRQYRLQLLGVEFTCPTEVQIISKDGTFKEIEFMTTFIQFQGAVAVMAILRDITEQKRVEKALAESERRYRELVELLSDIIFETDTDLKITYVNPIAFKKFGYSEREFNGELNLLEIIATSDRDQARDHAAQILRGEITEPREYLLRRKDGTTFYGLIHPRPIYRDGKIEGIRGTIHEITQQKLMEQKLQSAFQKIKNQNEKLKEIDRIKDEFYADISHEFRTPLVAIKGFAELLLTASNLEETQRDDIKIILRNERRIERLTSEMLEYSRLKSGKIKLQTDHFYISDIINEVEKEFLHKINQKQLIINKIIQPDVELKLDKYQITKVITNLISNAIKFSFPGGKVTIESRIEEKNWKFSVRDNGIGIAKKDLPKLFSRFVKLQKQKGINEDGIGIGLAISKKIIDVYNGTISVESKGLNRGSTFKIELPLK